MAHNTHRFFLRALVKILYEIYEIWLAGILISHIICEEIHIGGEKY